MRAALFALALFAAPVAAETPEQRLAAAGLALPPPNAPIGLYVPTARVGKLMFLAGHTECPIKATGKLGATMDVAAGKANAASVALCMLASIKAELGELSRVKRVVRVMGLVNATPDFTDHPAVMNGFSEVMVTAFGDAGKAPRTAAGAGSLPRGIPVEVEAIVELK
ncbi:RidA family protein [Sandarakinorhabdus rubra]|uniref:RidA family protein n=1 Tax=Sandarakinorhabdus rubra TaxID=2672568 RepID=UPI0013D90DE8|nr:RidA family protein [Sandarakinorhabdus rubra]